MVKKMAGSSKHEFISNNRSRRTTFKYRKKSLIKKIEQLSILCEIDVGAIIFPNQSDAEHGKKQLIVWPQDHTKIQELVSLYKAKAISSSPDPDNNPSCHSSSEDSNIPKLYDDLNELVQIVERRIAAVDNKIDFLRRCEGMQSGMPGSVDPGCSHHSPWNLQFLSAN